MERLSKGARVALVWTQSDGAHLQRVADALRARTGHAPDTEHSESLDPGGAYDAAVVADSGALAAVARVLASLRPGGMLVVWEVANTTAACTTLTLHGFVDHQHSPPHLVAIKPQFEVGARRLLRGGPAAEAAWGGAGATEGEELVDEERLLGDAERARPAPATLRVCASTGERRACADCSCGLAAELSAGAAAPQPTSACGSCYLGDAFRCAACPYRGLPAFRPGERVLLTDLAPDL